MKRLANNEHIHGTYGRNRGVLTKLAPGFKTHTDTHDGYPSPYRRAETHTLIRVPRLLLTHYPYQVTILNHSASWK